MTAQQAIGRGCVWSYSTEISSDLDFSIEFCFVDGGKTVVEKAEVQQSELRVESGYSEPENLFDLAVDTEAMACPGQKEEKNKWDGRINGWLRNRERKKGCINAKREKQIMKNKW